ncbi:MAG: polysulfide reductase NrfD [Betaproteobacteria bacterium]|jgi:Ni/Fe-hydrogenase subunit HybB-like protein|nr:polysulfide reductase NrfD [Betaproteobacteria bacterium]
MPPVAANPQSESRRYWGLVALAALLALAGYAAAHHMDVNGHAVTGMDNRVVWGLPHVFAILMIVAASGVLNVASIGSVFGQAEYKARAPLAGLLCIALLAGGLFVLMLDLGRPERMVVAATHYNFTSVFAWNVFIYTGMFAVAAAYLWTLMERRMSRWSGPLGVAALVWRFVLTTGTGAIFAFLVARPAYGSALLPPLFIVLSFAWGLAVFLVAQAAAYAWCGRALPEAIHARMRRLLGVFVAAALYFSLVHHLVNAYFAQQQAFERFLLVDGGLYPLLYWGAFVAAGSVAPLALLWRRGAPSAASTLAAALLVLLGAFAWLYVFVIGGQAYPQPIFPGFDARSSFGDGAIARYAPRWPELVLGIGGVALAALVTLVGARAFAFVPEDPATTPAPAARGAGAD